MVEETIKAIRETEAAADVIVKEAGEKSQKILEDARQEAERMIKSQEETHRILHRMRCRMPEKKPGYFRKRPVCRQRKKSRC